MTATTDGRLSPGPGRAAPEPRTASAPSRHRGRSGAIVLGMHRGGTSAVAGLLAAAGFRAGDQEDLCPADGDNPAGHFELKSVIQFNEDVLHELGATWYGPPFSGAVHAAGERLWPRLESLLAGILPAPGNPPVVVKDPRIAVLLPLWWPKVRDVLTPVVVLRNPLETARSLTHRDRFPLAMGLAMWEVYLSCLLDGLQGSAPRVVRYEQVVADNALAEDLVGSVTGTLDVSFAGHVDAAHARRGLVSELHRQRVADDDFFDCASPEQRRLWAFLGEELPSAPAAAAAAAVPAEFRRPSQAALDVIGRWMREERKATLAQRSERDNILAERERVLAERTSLLRRLREAGGTIRGLLDQLSESRKLAAELELRLSERQVACATTEARLAGVAGQVEALRRQREHTAALLLDSEQQLAILATARADEARQPASPAPPDIVEAHLRAVVRDLEHQVEALQASTSWKVTAPMRAVSRLRAGLR